MSYGLWLSTAGMQTNQYRQSIMANNLANSDTTGFKHDLAVIQERLTESASSGAQRRFAHPVFNGMTGGTFVRPTVHTFEQGRLDETGNPLDLAIEGEGFFAVQDGNETRYTRDGRFTTNARGELVMVAGEGRMKLLSPTGQRVVLDESGEPVTVAGDGTIRQGESVVGKVGLFSIANREQLTKVGSNVYRNHGPEPDVVEGRIRSRHLELSTADPITGLAQMIEVARAFQLNANMISLQDQTIGQAVGTVGRIR